MKSLFLKLALAVLFCLPAAAGTAPWQAAQSLLSETQASLQKEGIRGVSSHRDDIEKALDEGAACFPFYDSGSGDIIVLTDGMTDTLAALAAATEAQKQGKLREAKVVAIGNPYPVLAFYLGSYNNEIGRYADAERVLAKGLKLVVLPGFAAMVPSLTSEHAIALARLGRMAEALAEYDAGLKFPGIDDRGKARMLRGRGYVLTEMEMLDEAAAAYTESLKFDPGNKIALGELDYIAKLKMGGTKLPGATLMPDDKPKK